MDDKTTLEIRRILTGETYPVERYCSIERAKLYLHLHYNARVGVGTRVRILAALQETPWLIREAPLLVLHSQRE